MTKILAKELSGVTELRGRIGKPRPQNERGFYGVAVAGEAGYGDDGTAGLPASAGIYQMRHCHEGYIPIKIRLYDQRYTTSEILQNNRNKFKEAMLLWKTLTNSEKAVYYKKVKNLKMHANNYFVREYLKNN